MKAKLIFLIVFLSLVACGAGKKERPLEYPEIRKGEADVILYTGYAVSYSAEWRIPIWVAYQLTGEETNGTASKYSKGFRRDTRVKEKQADHYDYKGSGWSRGHMAPAADFKWSDDALDGTYYYTNCCPQDQQLNNGPWNVLENKVRAWARKFGSVWVVTGPVVTDRRYGLLGVNEVVIPDAFYKAILIRDGEEWKAIGFVMSNDSDPHPLQSSFCTIDEVEALTGLDFFPSLPDRTENLIESSVDPTSWGL